MRYITVEDLSFYYDKEPVLEHINYSVDSGEFVTLTGENGAAKTTLIKASLGILQPRIGKVTISKTNTQGKKLRIAYLPQQIASFNAGFPSTVYEFVKSGRYPRKGWFRRLNAHDEEHILMLLSEESLTNSELARRLNVSQAAVTKAIKSLVKEGMLETSRDPKDARVIFYQLTDLARPIAEEHHHHHEHTLLTYEQVATQFTPNEQKVIQRFLTALVGEIK